MFVLLRGAEESIEQFVWEAVGGVAVKDSGRAD